MRAAHARYMILVLCSSYSSQLDKAATHHFVGIIELVIDPIQVTPISHIIGPSSNLIVSHLS